MKKFILPLLLLLAVGMLAAVESDPSAVVGYVKYDIVSGNSMVALPMDTSLALAGDVGALVGATTVSYWDNDAQAFVAAEYIDWMGDWDNNFAVTNGMALLVYSDAPTADFYSIGALPIANPTYPIVAGNSMLMIPLDRSDLAFAGMVGTEAGATTVSYWDTDAQAFVASEYIDWMGDWDNNFATTIGNPLMVYSAEGGVTFPAPPARTSNTSRHKYNK